MNKIKLGKLFGFFILLNLAFMLLGCEQEEAIISSDSTGWMDDYKAVINQSRKLTPVPPWPVGDEKGMANTLGVGTWMRCAFHLNQPGARVYELAHVRSNDMPSSFWAPAIKYEYSLTEGLPHTLIAHHSGMKVTGVSGAQGTQMDAFGHWGVFG